ncbi:enoyl-CoA hydratase/isomerase family protein [Bradyrhizobium arachidis]|uniref:enoyl-CoA hydratase/isomerase family protein n=1 Tax=Bradyrhizobium arachidis TaxID=858423 RepID=UPI002163EFFB|nr:enoyl-CoA hydratase/isomerase family protein [Bradyrhizobium arachidis]UVO35709.1 enoyl-CoA hydratase/isomerase family protein [Bradyrhizobium arachidis]
MTVLNVYMKDAVLVAQFNREKPVNPLNRELQTAIVETCQFAESEPAVKAIVLTGGVRRSFCVGDDFREARARTQADVEELVDRVTWLCVAILSVTKPVVAGIDGYAIGGGLQIALCCDLRVGTKNTKVLGWELKHGIGYPVGAYMLEKSLGRAAMSDIIFGCEVVPADWAARYRLFHELANPSDVVEKAVSRAAVLATYPEVSYRRTKAAVNRSFVSGLKELMPIAKKIHVDCFLSGAADAHLAKVLRDGGRTSGKKHWNDHV